MSKMGVQYPHQQLELNMAYVSKEMKAQIAPVVKDLLKKYGLKGSLSVHNHSTLTLTISQGEIDFIGAANLCNKKFAERRGEQFHEVKDYIQVNPYYVDEHYEGKAREFLSSAASALRGSDYFDHSDSQTDYFHCSHYIGINIGKWDKPYTLVA